MQRLHISSATAPPSIRRTGCTAIQALEKMREKREKEGKRGGQKKYLPTSLHHLIAVHRHDERGEYPKGKRKKKKEKKEIRSG